MYGAQAPSLLGRKLQLAIALTFLVLIGELVGGYFANSLALMSDAGHVFTDLLALLLSWFGVKQTERPPSHRMTYGYHRVAILTALINAMALVAIALVILYEAYRRFQEPPKVESGLMLGVAVVGLVVNLIVMYILRRDQTMNLSVRSAYLHVLGDTLGSVGVILGGLAIFYTGWYWVDPAVSVFIGLVIAFGSWRIVWEGVNIFLEASPGHLDTVEVVRTIYTISGIKDVHDLHIWTIAPQIHALSCHVLIDDGPVSQGTQVLGRLNEVLATRFNIGHSTIQLECEGCDPNELYCNLSPEGLARNQSSAKKTSLNLP